MPAQFPPHPIGPARWVVRGTFVDAPTAAALRVRRDCEIVVGTNGTIESITDANGPRADPDPHDCYIELKEGQLVCPGLVDCVRIYLPAHLSISRGRWCLLGRSMCSWFPGGPAAVRLCLIDPAVRRSSDSWGRRPTSRSSNG